MNHSAKNSLKYMIALKNYTNPNNSNSDELKPKMSPLQIQKPFQMPKNVYEKKNKEKRHTEPINSNAMQLISKCYAVTNLLDKQKEKNTKTQQCILQFIKRYYSQMRNIITKCENKVVVTIQTEMEKIRELLEDQKLKILQKIIHLQDKNNYKDCKINQLNEIDIPYFEIDGDYIRQFQKIVEKFKPNFIYLETNKTHEEQKCIKTSTTLQTSQQKQNSHTGKQDKFATNSTEENTVKKQCATIKLQKNLQQICQFSCDEEIQWNSIHITVNKKQNKPEIIHQIILEEPSSCQDSMIINDVL